MRYLVENNDYTILYNEQIGMTMQKGKTIPVIEAWLINNETNESIFRDLEHWKGKLEPCLMKLGKRLQKKWQNRKK